MSRPLIVGLVAEGPTDQRFLEPIIRKTFEQLLLSGRDEEVDIYPIQRFTPEGHTFVEKVQNASRRARESGVMLLCVHADADGHNDNRVFNNKITPAMESVRQDQNACHVLLPIVPVHMTEAWMLADVDLLKRELNTDFSNQDLRLTQRPEAYADPKAVLNHAIDIAQQSASRRRKRYQLTSSDLYQPIGQKIDLTRLESLPSYRKFRESSRAILSELGFLR